MKMQANGKETALSLAMMEKGIKPPLDALFDLALEAWRKWSTDEGRGARRDHVTSRLRGELTWALMEQCNPSALTQAVGWLINQAKEEIEAQSPQPKSKQKAGSKDPAAAAGPATSRNPKVCRPAAATRDEMPGASSNSGPRLGAPSASQAQQAMTETVPMEPPPAAPDPRTIERLEARMAAEMLIRVSRLDTFLIKGKPIGDCSVARVKEWVKKRDHDRLSASRDVRFALSLVANLPSNAVIRDYWTNPDEVETLYQTAELAYAA